MEVRLLLKFWGEKLSWIKRGAENVLLKKLGIIFIFLGILISILIIHQYMGMINETKYTNKIIETHCDSDLDCAICDGVCKSTIGSVCKDLEYSTNCKCVNHTCTNILNK